MVDPHSVIGLLLDKEIADEASRLGDENNSPIQLVDAFPPEGHGDPVIELEGDCLRQLLTGQDLDIVLSDEP